jgi:glycosyltransferase involved in cell wall biosynthesis
VNGSPAILTQPVTTVSDSDPVMPDDDLSGVAGLRVLILNENESVPGDRRVWDISTTLASAGADVVVICPQDERGGSAQFESRDGVEIHRYRPSFAEGGPAGYVREYGQAFWSTWSLVRRLSRERRFDIVHACNPPDFLLFAARPARRGGARFVFDHHDLTPELFRTRFGENHRLLYRATLSLERWCFHAADVVLATNESYQEIARTRGGKSAEDVFIVRNAPNLNRLAQVTPDPSLKRGKPHLIGYLGVMAPQDGVDNAIRALARLRERRQDWHAVFGGEGSAVPELKELADQLGLGDMVEFPGWMGDAEIGRLLSTSDVCLSPEPATPLNDRSTMVKIAEYMAMSRPIVAFSLRETRKSADAAAVYAESGDIAAFADRIGELLDDPQRRAEMGAIGRERVERSMTWARSTTELMAAYRRAMAHRVTAG